MGNMSAHNTRTHTHTHTHTYTHTHNAHIHTLTENHAIFISQEKNSYASVIVHKELCAAVNKLHSYSNCCFQ